MTVPLTSKRLLAFTPPDLRKGHPEISFDLRVPNYQDRDELGLRLYRMGLRTVTTDNIRALMVSELFSMPLGATPEEIEIEAEKRATFLESHWNLQQLDEIDQQAWSEQEQQRLLDIAGGATDPIPEMKPMPPKRTTIRDRARVSLMTQEIVDASEMVRAKLADQQSYDIHYRLAMIRLHLGGINGLETKLKLDGGLVNLGCIEALREELGRYSTIAFEEMFREIDGLYELPKVERGNSDSPPANTSQESGSPSTSGESDDSAGSSTTSNTGPAPGDVSPTITATSSEPSSDAETSMDRSDGLTTVA